MNNTAINKPFESRWPVAISILLVLAVLTLLPTRTRLMPEWFPYIMCFSLLFITFLSSLNRRRKPWDTFERYAMLTFSFIAEAVTFITLMVILIEMLNHPLEFGGKELLSSSIAAWFTNVFSFSIIFWQIDRGGPEERLKQTIKKPEWLFAQAQIPDQVPDNWHPKYADYLFLSFSTATAFSPTDTLPLTVRAKMLMMLESSVSLITLIALAARAINILGS